MDWRSVATGAGTLRPRELVDEALRVGDLRLFASKGPPGHPPIARFGGMTTGLVWEPRAKEASRGVRHDGVVGTPFTVSLLLTSRWQDDVETNVLLGAMAGSLAKIRKSRKATELRPKGFGRGYWRET